MASRFNPVEPALSTKRKAHGLIGIDVSVGGSHSSSSGSSGSSSGGSSSGSGHSSSGSSS